MTTAGPAVLEGESATPGDPAAGDAPVIQTRALTKRYGSLTAVDALDLDVRRGEIYGLLGPNGAGKTTTILMLLGLTSPTSGEVSVLGLDPARQPLQVKRRVGYLPDNVGFYGSLTGRENLRYTARLNGLDGRDTEPHLGHVLDQVGLSGRADDRVETYSRGMRQRLGIADALVKDPPILVLDEPTTAIDPIGVVEILDLVRSLARDRGIAILLASHLLDQVQSVCHRAGIFDRGRLVGQGRIEELAVAFGEGSDRIEVGVELDGAAGAARVHELIAGVAGVVSAEPLESTGARASWRLAIGVGHDERAVGRAVLDAILGAGLRLDHFGRARPSLEQIYRHAVERAQGTRAEAAVPDPRPGGAR